MQHIGAQALNRRRRATASSGAGISAKFSGRHGCSYSPTPPSPSLNKISLSSASGREYSKLSSSSGMSTPPMRARITSLPSADCTQFSDPRRASPLVSPIQRLGKRSSQPVVDAQCDQPDQVHSFKPDAAAFSSEPASDPDFAFRVVVAKEQVQSQATTRTSRQTDSSSRAGSRKFKLAGKASIPPVACPCPNQLIGKKSSVSRQSFTAAFTPRASLKFSTAPRYSVQLPGPPKACFGAASQAAALAGTIGATCSVQSLACSEIIHKQTRELEGENGIADHGTSVELRDPPQDRKWGVSHQKSCAFGSQDEMPAERLRRSICERLHPHSEFAGSRSSLKSCSAKKPGQSGEPSVQCSRKQSVTFAPDVGSLAVCIPVPPSPRLQPTSTSTPEWNDARRRCARRTDLSLEVIRHPLLRALCGPSFLKKI